MGLNNDKKDKQDELNKILYNYIGYHYVEDINKDIESNMEDIENIEIPKSLDNWFLELNQKIKNKSRNNKYKNSLKKFISKLAVIFLVFGISLAILRVTTEADRVRLLSIIMRGNYQYLDIKVVDDTVEDIPNIETKKYYLPKYTPDGFKLDSINELDETKSIIYLNQDNEEIVFSQAHNGINFKIDSKDSILKDIDINGMGGIIILKEERIILFWHNEEYSFCLSSTIEQEELISMARSLIKK